MFNNTTNGFILISNSLINATNQSIHKFYNFIAAFMHNITDTFLSVAKESFLGYLEPLIDIFSNNKKDYEFKNQEEKNKLFVKNITKELENSNNEINEKIIKTFDNKKLLLEKTKDFLEKDGLSKFDIEMANVLHLEGRDDNLIFDEKRVSKKKIARFKELSNKMKSKHNSLTDLTRSERTEYHALSKEMYTSYSVTLKNKNGEEYILKVGENGVITYEEYLELSKNNENFKNVLKKVSERNEDLRDFLFSNSNHEFAVLANKEVRAQILSLNEKIKEDKKIFEELELNNVFAAQLNRENRKNEAIFNYNNDLVDNLKNFNLRTSLSFFTDEKKNYFSSFFPNAIKTFSNLIDNFFDYQPEFNFEKSGELIEVDSYKIEKLEDIKFISYKENDILSKDIYTVSDLLNNFKTLEDLLRKRCVEIN